MYYLQVARVFDYDIKHLNKPKIVCNEYPDWLKSQRRTLLQEIKWRTSRPTH